MVGPMTKDQIKAIMRSYAASKKPRPKAKEKEEVPFRPMEGGKVDDKAIALDDDDGADWLRSERED